MSIKVPHPDPETAERIGYALFRATAITVIVARVPVRAAKHVARELRDRT